MLRRTPGVPKGEFDDCVAELTGRDVLRTGAGGRLTLRHPVLRSLVYENIAERRRTAVHRAAADELARSGAPAAERAHHVERSIDGWDPAAADVLTDAAAQFARTAPATAAHLLQVVLGLMPVAPEHAARRGELTLARARALGVGGDLLESRRLLHALISADAGVDAALRADAIALCAMMEQHLGHCPQAVALLRRELSASPGPPPGQEVALGLALGMSALLTVSFPEVRAELARSPARTATRAERPRPWHSSPSVRSTRGRRRRPAASPMRPRRWWTP